MWKDPIYNLEHLPEFIVAFRQLKNVGWETFLNRLEHSTALKLKSCQTNEERYAIQVRMLMIDELRNFSKSLFAVDKDT